MLSISTCTADMAKDYYTQDDYYTKDSTLADVWQGELARELGIDGQTVTAEQFEIMLYESGQGCSAYDLTFSAPKSVSIVAETAEVDQRRAVIAAHNKAVEETLAEIERNEVYTRTKRCDVITEHQTAQMAAAKFMHHLSRELDPELHTHAVVLNKTIYNGEDYTIFGKRLFSAAKVYSFEYRARLARELQKLGYTIEVTDVEKGFFEIEGFQEEVLREFSKRRQQIEAYAREHGVSENEATLKTRRAKEPNVNLEEQRAKWKETLECYGQELPKPQVKNKQVFTSDEKIDAYREAVESLQFKEFAWNQKQFEEAVVAHGIGVGMTRAEAQYIIEEDNVTLKGNSRIDGEAYFTTEHNISQQEKIFSVVEEGRGRWSYAIGSEVVDAELRNIQEEKDMVLSKQQSGLVHHVAESMDQIIAVRGLAGTGKTFALDVAREVLERKGYEVRGMSASGQAAMELSHDAHLPKCTTIQHALNAAEKEAGGKIDEDYTQKTEWRLDGLKPSKKPTVWFMDEASLTDNNTLLYALEMVHKRGDKLVMIGDDKQLPLVGVGNSFSEMVQQDRISTAILSEIQRQKDSPEVLEAVNEIAMGTPGKALEALSDNILEIEKGKDRLKAVTDAYCELSPEEQKETMILTAKNSEREALNIQIRERLIQCGQLDRGQTYLVEPRTKKIVEREFSAGDKVVFLKNDMRLGIMNGTKGEIQNTEGDVFRISIDGGKVISIDIREYRYIEHGYAVTTHKAQGATVKRAMINLNSNNTKLNSRNAFYVDVSRAQIDVQIFCDKKDKLSEQISQFSIKHSIRDINFRKRSKSSEIDFASLREKVDCKVTGTRLLLDELKRELKIEGGESLLNNEDDRKICMLKYGNNTNCILSNGKTRD
ncbi:MAG: conjugative relaxase [Selenomonas ruminantium]|nr:conjugative relaxase [Selenomonas ruminantium]